MITEGGFQGQHLLPLVSDFYEREVQPVIYVGIGIAKFNHYASAISSDDQELMKPFEFTNDNDGFQLLNFCLTELSYEVDSNIVLESTAHYDNKTVLRLE